MQYKTIALELLREHTELHEQLRLTRRLLPTMERCAKELKASHEAWKTSLTQSQPESHPSQISSEALELALKELKERLPSVSLLDESELPTLDRAMAFLISPMSKE